MHLVTLISKSENNEVKFKSIKLFFFGIAIVKINQIMF